MLCETISEKEAKNRAGCKALDVCYSCGAQRPWRGGQCIPCWQDAVVLRKAANHIRLGGGTPVIADAGA